MAWWPFRRKAAPQVEITEDKLQWIPSRPENVEVREDSRGMIHLRVAQAPGGFAKKVADWLHQDYTRTLELDEFGTFFYQQVDGKTSLKKIIKHMYARFKTVEQDVPVPGSKERQRVTRETSVEEMKYAVVLFTKSLMLKNALVLQRKV